MVWFSGDPAGTCTSHANTARLTVDQLVLDSATRTVEVCVGAGLTVANTAEPSVTRTFGWGISKSADETSQTVAPGEAATFNYSVQLTHDDGSDGWRTTGTIDVFNPNDWEPITADVTDAADNGGDCAVTGGPTVTILRGGHVELPYTCTYVSPPSPLAGTNTATATWEPTAFATKEGSAPAGAAVDFGTADTTIVDGSVVVTDTLAGSLGTVSSSDPNPPPFTYKHVFSGDPAGTCTSHLNTAAFTTDTTGTTGSDDRTVTVCVTGGAKDLTVAKTAYASFTRTYPWTVTQVGRQARPERRGRRRGRDLQLHGERDEGRLRGLGLGDHGHDHGHQPEHPRRRRATRRWDCTLDQTQRDRAREGFGPRRLLVRAHERGAR